MTESWHRRTAKGSHQLFLLAALVLGLAGIGLLGTVDAVSCVEARAEQFLLSLAIATAHRLDDVVKINDLLLFFPFHCS